MNNNSSTAQALAAGCQGVFQTTSYISIGDPGKPLMYGQKEKDRACYQGKQMTTNPGKHGAVPEVYFDKKFPWISDGDHYTDKMSYAKTQKEKKKGFLTGDFRRRDEFSNTLRTLQYRELLELEDKHRKKVMENMSEFQEADPEIKAKLDREAAEKEAKHKGQHLFDLVYDKDLPPEVCKISRDTKNPTSLSYTRDFGTYQTSQMSYGYGIHEMDHDKPKYARLPIVQSTFYRPSKVPLNNLP